MPDANTTKSWKTRTGYFVLLLIVSMLLYDLIAMQLGGFDATVSRFIVGLSADWPIVPFLAGVVAGHFWFPVMRDAPASQSKKEEGA